MLWSYLQREVRNLGLSRKEVLETLVGIRSDAVRTGKGKLPDSLSARLLSGIQ